MKLISLNTFRSGVAVLATALLMGTALPSLAYDVTSTAAINVDANGVILRGMDPTSYATGAAPVAGDADFKAEVGGATYLFASAEARDSFVAAPATYEPAFGGFCAVGAALGKKLDGDPAIFRTLNGKLYLFVSEDAVAMWDKDPAGTLAKANANWPNISDKTPASLE
jgi:YHS domain-containing protein